MEILYAHAMLHLPQTANMIARGFNIDINVIETIVPEMTTMATKTPRDTIRPIAARTYKEQIRKSPS